MDLVETLLKTNYMSKKEFIKMLVSSFGYTNIEINSCKSGTNGGQSDNVTIWSVKAFKKDARGDRNLDFREGTFELFVKYLSKLLWNLS